MNGATNNVSYYLGLDLGQPHEISALAVLERPKVLWDAPRVQRRPPCALRHLQRCPLGTSYPEIFQKVRTLLQTPPMDGTFVVVDQTGVGKPVLAMMAESLQNQVTCRFCPVTLTAGQA